MGMTPPRWNRVLLKLAGEAFAGGAALGIDPSTVGSIARQVADIVRSGVQVAIVVGGGNMFRGALLAQRGVDRPRADYMGMLSTVINCLALQDFLEKEGIETRVQTAITMGQVAEPYVPRRAIRHLEKGRVLIFGAGLVAPFFSTDTTAAQRALEAGATVLLFQKIVVDYYGALTPGNQLASFHVPEPRMAVITPYDKSALGNIERAIRDSDLGVNPTNDGNIIRVVFPQLTEERRKELIKVARHKAEEGRVAVRNIRRHAKDTLD